MSLGPEWGNAHIEVHADTSPLRRELRAAAATSGKEFGKDWGDAAETELGKELSVLGRHIETAMKGRGEDAGTNWGDEFENGLRRRLKRFDMNIIESALSGDWSFAIEQFGGLDQALDGLHAKFEQMRQDSGLSSAAFQDMEGSLLNWSQRIRHDNAFQVLHDDALKMNAEFDRSKKEAADFDKALTQAFNDIEDAAHKANKEFDRTTTAKAREEYAALHRESKALHFEITKMLKAHDDEDRALQRTRDSAHAAALEFEKVGGAVRGAVRNFSLAGRLKGSRNNFINLLGVMGVAAENFGDGLLKVLTSGQIPAAIATFTSNFRGLGDVFRDQGVLSGLKEFGNALKGGLGGLTEGGGKGGITGAILGAVAGFLQLAQAIGAVVLIIGSLNVVAPAITGLLGILTALASSVAFALAGFLLPIGPAALAAAAGVGALVVAFKDAGDETKKAVQPFKDFFKEIKKPVQDALFRNLTAQVEGLKGVLNNFLGPLLIAAAGELSRVFDYVVLALNRPDVQNTLRILGETLPPILHDLGTALTDFVTGLLGFFAPIATFTQIIAQNIADAAWQFSQWANSAEGQTAIGDFFAGASASAQILWDLIVNVGAALGTLFSQGKETGDGFLQKIVEIVQKFTDWANSDEGRAKIASWMAFARDLAGQLWAAIETVGRMIARLDTPENRAALLSLIGAFTSILDAIGKVAAAVAPLAPAFNIAFRVIGALAQSAAGLIQNIATAIENVIRALGRITVPSALRTLAELVGKVSGNMPNLPKTATGGMFFNAQARIIGEAGPEAVVPLNRPLAQVDPSVRWLSALAQGKTGGLGAQGAPSSGRTITVMEGAIQVSAPVRNEALVASMVLDGLVSRVK